MNRRAFVQRLLAGAAGLALGAELDVERLLWVPKPIVTVPAMPVPFRFVSPDWLTRDALAQLERNLSFTKLVYLPGPQVGQTITIRSPARFR